MPSWDELAPYYSAEYDPYDPAHSAEAGDEETLRLARARGEFRHVQIREGMRLLDVGCGAGYFLRIAGRLGARVQGVEPSAVGAERARAAGIDVFHGTVDAFAAGTAARFDLVTANHVLEHTPNPVSTLRAMASVLAPGGIIWIAVPNAACWFNTTLRGKWHSVDVPYHLQQFVPGSLSRAAERAGLQVASLGTHSLPSATGFSIKQVLRHHCKIPMRLLNRIGVDRAGPAVARALDVRARGEAILARFLPGSSEVGEAPPRRSEGGVR